MVSTLTSSGDSRNSRARTVGSSEKLTFTTTVGENTKTLDISHISGQVVGIEYLAPDLTTDTTFDLDFYSRNDVLLASKASLADAKTTGFFVNTYTDNIFIPTDSKLKCSFTTAQVATIEVILHMK